MATEIRVPSLGESVVEATVGQMPLHLKQLKALLDAALG